MPKYADVATPMPNSFKGVKFLNTSNGWNVDDFQKLKPLVPFSDEVVVYLNLLSKELYQNTNLKSFPDVATFAFYCRKANILSLKNKHSLNDRIKLGRGIVFHISPSNVPVNFAYSFLAGLLAGNSNIVRVPSRDFDQVNMIVEAMNAIANKDEAVKVANRIVLVKYDRENHATDVLSLICDVRIIWGGDTTIRQIRQKPLSPRAFDVTFSDRYSMCIINADMYINSKDTFRIASNFYNDTYLFDQNACTSPHLVVWTGNNKNVKKSQEIFWDVLYKILEKSYQITPLLSIDKMTNYCHQVISTDEVSNVKKKDNLLWRVNLEKLSGEIDGFRCNSGYFSEYHASSLLELSQIINRKYQTVAYYGFDKSDLVRLINELQPFGIDRMVPIGRTMDFSLTWDGYNLIDSLSREVEIL